MQSSSSPSQNPFKSFVQSQSFAGILLLICTLMALTWANSPYAAQYFALSHATFGIHLQNFSLQKSLLHWINDGLMTLFFLWVGLEIKRELLIGELNTRGKALLPIAAAIGGMTVPALIYVAINFHTPQYLSGWAIPSATDIAFALGILSLLGKKVPRLLVVFLTAVAIADDLGAVLIIALFYNQTLMWHELLWVGLFLAILIALNRLRSKYLSLYLIIGVCLWYFLLHSGIHAALAGVFIAFCIPTRAPNKNKKPPLQRLEHGLQAPVTYVVLPLFVLFNAGVSLQGASLTHVLASPITLGIIVGLVFGKCIGIFGITALFVRCRWVQLPNSVTLRHFLPISILAGIGFTMSIFIADLAFPGQAALLMQAKVGILCASLLAAILGYVLMRTLGQKNNDGEIGPEKKIYPPQNIGIQ